MRLAMLAIIIWSSGLGTPALAQTITYDYDRAADFSAYKTYAWARGTDLEDESNHARLVGAIDAVLTAKGLARVEPASHPDVLVAYYASVDHDLEVTRPTRGWGAFGRGGRWGSAQFWPIVIGLVVVEMSDARTNALVWRSYATSDVTAHDAPEIRDKKIAKAARKIFEHYPPRDYRTRNATPRR